MEIKICGITSLDDAMAACEAGADALGFIFYQRSPRYLSPKRAREIIGKLPQEVAKVGVFVNDQPERIEHISGICGLDFLQFHGDETPRFCSRFPAATVIKALSPQSAADLEQLTDYPVRAILVDAVAPGLYGGTGKISNWGLAGTIGETHPLILSGGLNSSNIEDAITAVSPRAVDINSGVESSPGKKDHDKVREIIRIIRSANGRAERREGTIFHDH
ncbi:MAG TPA: phosphoribosylanthranilate isomerase [Syntrophales bacterium]|nr:phosphoribosylanthranilate isomerase [Syntrophales bacterium]